MPLNTVEVSRTFHLGDHNFFKIGQDGTIAENETREQLTDDALKFIYATVEKYFPSVTPVKPNYEDDLPVIQEKER